VIRVNPTTGAQATVSSGGSFVDPSGIAVEADGDILVADANAFGGGGGVIRVDPATGAQTTVSSGSSFP
jgi:NHL repeat